MWKYNPITGQFIFVEITPPTYVSEGTVSFGDSVNGDISIDTGNRDNTTSVMDSGLRVVQE